MAPIPICASYMMYHMYTNFTTYFCTSQSRLLPLFVQLLRLLLCECDEERVRFPVCEHIFGQ